MGNTAAPVPFPASNNSYGLCWYALLLVAFWFVARHFGFGAAEMLQRFLSNRTVRVLVAGLLLVPYLIFSVPRGEFLWTSAVALFSIPVAIAALFASLH